MLRVLRVRALEDVLIPSFKVEEIRTGLNVKVPKGCYERIAPRCGLALNHSFDIGGRVIDPDYEGEVIVILYNHGCEDFKVESGMNIAHLLCEKIEMLVPFETEKKGANMVLAVLG